MGKTETSVRSDMNLPPVLVRALLALPFLVLLSFATEAKDWKRIVDQVIERTKPYETGVSYQDFVLRRVDRAIVDLRLDPDDGGALTKWVDVGLQAPGLSPEDLDRLLVGLDVASVLTKPENFRPVFEHRDRMTLQSLEQIEKARNDSVTVHKLYNEGTVICAAGSCVGIDILLHPDPMELASRFAAALDGLLISHSHGDHFDRRSQLHPELKDAGKPVILPDMGVDKPIGAELDAGEIGALRWTAYRGMHVQTDRPSAYFVLEIDGRTIVHSGDNTRWMPFARSVEQGKVDLLLLKPESLYVDQTTEDGIGQIQAAMVESLDLIRPKLITPHHLLELGHGLGAYSHAMGLRLRRQAPAGSQVKLVHWGGSITVP